MKRLLSVALLAVAVAAAGCGEYQKEVYVDIGPNETGFYVPLEGKTSDGAKFDSLEVVEAMKVAAKRITIPTREYKTGRGWTAYTYIPQGLVVKVHRAAVTREWTDEDGTGTNKDSNEALRLGSRDGIAFKLGFTATAHIEEQYAARFLYNWGQKDLASVLDTNVRSSLLTELGSRCGQLGFDDCLTRYTTVATDAVAAVTKEFLERGVTIDFMGPQGKPIPENDAVQKVLDEKFIAENSKAIAANQASAQIEKNRQLVESQKGMAEMSVIEAEAAAKVQIAKAKGDAESIRAKAEADAFRILETAKAEATGNEARAKALEGEGGLRLVSLKQIEQWGGTLPSFLINGGGGQGIPFILNLPSEAVSPPSKK